MRVVRSRDTTAEINIRKALHAKGLRSSIDCAVLPDLRRRADIAFPRLRIAVFVDGCFWHSCPRHRSQPKANGEWWIQKLAANRRRDADTNRRLRRAGWLVIRIWEHEPPSRAADVIASVVMERRSHLQDARLAGLEESPSFSKRRGAGPSRFTAQ
jgi:DNA mismatch endonuclease (patch repair protein)